MGSSLRQDNLTLDVAHMTIKDFSLDSGERQVGRTVDQIRRDHTERYELVVNAMNGLTEGATLGCLDIFCGNGYGTYMMSIAHSWAHVIGIDGSREAIDFANECYSLPNNLYAWKLYPFTLPARSFDIAVCFESLEHVEDDSGMFEQLLSSLRVGGLAFISVPNQDLHPLEKNPHRFHFRHYHHAEFVTRIPNNFSIINWYGQNTYVFTEDLVNTFTLLPPDEMSLKEGQHGQVNVYVIRRDG